MIGRGVDVLAQVATHVEIFNGIGHVDFDFLRVVRFQEPLELYDEHFGQALDRVAFLTPSFLFTL